MAIIKAEQKTYIEIETDDADESHYRRFGPDKWYYLSGLSWEEAGYPEDLEAAYQEFSRPKEAATEKLIWTGEDSAEYFTLEKQYIMYWEPRPDGNWGHVPEGRLAGMDKDKLRQTQESAKYYYRHFGDGHWEMDGDEGWVTCDPPTVIED